MSKTKRAFDAGWRAGRIRNASLAEDWSAFELEQAKRPAWYQLVRRLILFVVLTVGYFTSIHILHWFIG